MSNIMEFDPTGAIAVLYAKQIYMQLCKEQTVSLYDLFTENNKEGLAADREMWNILVSKDVMAAEQQILDTIDAIIAQAGGMKQIGERDMKKEKEALFDGIAGVVEELTQCKTSLYLKGGPIGKVKNFSTKIHVFERLAECLLALEQAPDGMYLCYVSCGGTADGYFGFYIKSNGTILSLSERIDEAYPGQHKNSRNGRWSENKKYSLFPYNFVFSYSEYDYLGYAHRHTINDSDLAICNLEPEAYMPLILAMVMTASKFAEIDISDFPVMLVDSLFQRNLDTALPETEALVVPSNSALAAVGRNYRPSITTEDILGTDMAKKLSDCNRPFTERGTFDTQKNIFVELYGEGFELDASKLLVSDPHLKMLTAEERQQNADLTPNAEFIGSADRMELIAYMQGRQQLAEYIREQMKKEYVAAGGAEGIAAWWKNAMQQNKEKIFQMCARKYLDCQKGECENVSSSFVPPLDAPGLRYVNFEENNKHRYRDFHLVTYPFNAFGEDKYGREDTYKPLCPITGTSTSIVFAFRPDTWEELEQLFGDVPKILKGWKRQGHWHYGNSILDVTDKVTEVGTPFERDEQQRNKSYCGEWDWRQNVGRPQTDFNFGVAFSKRGFAKLLSGGKTSV